MKKRFVIVILISLIAVMLTSLNGCEKLAEAGEISEYDSESHIPITGDDSQTGSNSDSAAGFVVRDRKYDYEGNNLVILNVENHTNNNYAITIKGRYLDADGAVLKEESKTFEGFAAGWKNYFFFVPGIPFEQFTYSLEAETYGEECYAKTFKYTWEFVEHEMGIPWDDWHADEASYEAALSRGETDVQIPQTYFVPVISFELYREYEIDVTVTVTEDIVILNSQGEVMDVRPNWFTAKCFPGEPSNNGHDYYYFPDPDHREWPKELKDDLTVLFGIASIQPSK